MPQLDSSAFWGIAGIVVGFAIAAFFFIIGKKKTLLQFETFTTPLITEKMAGIPGISIAIYGQPVKNVVSTTIKFLNSGNQRIASTDFAEQDKLRIVLAGKLYSYGVSKGNQKLVPTLESVDDETINIAFENLKPKQYFTVTILHDGSLDVFGELKTGEMREYSPRGITVIRWATFSIFLVIVPTFIGMILSVGKSMSYSSVIVGVLCALLVIYDFFMNKD